MLSVEHMSARSMTPEHVTAWSRLQQNNPQLSSPYFRPEYTAAVAAVRDDVEVAVLKQRGEIQAFFPFQRSALDLGQPAGGRLSDFHGVVSGGDFEWDAGELLQKCGLAGWEFHHLLAAQQPFASFHELRAESPYIDLSQGFDAWRAERKAAGSGELEQTLRKQRKLERDVGDVRFELHTTDRQVFETLLAWKADQYRRTDLANVFGVDWTVRLLEHILERQTEDFAGMLSALYVGDRLIAAHCGMRSANVLHCWFPAYDVEYARYSPGLILLIELARRCEDLGVRRIDLGKGDERYKRSFASGAIAVAEGAMYCRSMARTLRTGWRRTKDWIRATPFRDPARKSLRWVRSVCGRHEFL